MAVEKTRNGPIDTALAMMKAAVQKAKMKRWEFVKEERDVRPTGAG